MVIEKPELIEPLLEISFFGSEPWPESVQLLSKAYSMDILYQLSMEIPEIKHELGVLIETQMPEFLVGLKSRGKKY